QDDSKLSVSLLRRLADEIIRQMKTNPGIFLVVSTDFSHHRDAVATLAADRRSEEFLENMTSDRFMDAFCDNRGGFLVLSLVAEALDSGKSWILAHSTSAEISGVADNDITSYFFSFFH
ncbi:MAG: AmmeMemoRadiSam system protein B, partial [Spirochaetaceae bacterium]